MRRTIRDGDTAARAATAPMPPDAGIGPHRRSATRWRPDPGREVRAVRRGALAVTADPPVIWRHDRPIALSPSETALLSLIVRRGRAPYAEIEPALEAAGASAKSLDVLLYRIRRKFLAAGAPDPISTIRNWGLMCRVEPDIHGSRSLWIGDSMPVAHP